MIKTVKVKARAGLRLPLPLRIKAAPGATNLVVTDAEAVELPRVAFVVRRLRQGDLVEVKAGNMSAASEPATAPIVVAEIKGDGEQ